MSNVFPISLVIPHGAQGYFKIPNPINLIKYIIFKSFFLCYDFCVQFQAIDFVFTQCTVVMR